MKANAKKIVRDQVMAAAHCLRHGYKKDASRNEAIGIAHLELAEDLEIIDHNTCTLGTAWLHTIRLFKLDPSQERELAELRAWSLFDNTLDQ